MGRRRIISELWKRPLHWFTPWACYPRGLKSMTEVDLSFLYQSSLASASLVPATAVVKPCCRMNQNLKIYLYFTLL